MRCSHTASILVSTLIVLILLAGSASADLFYGLESQADAYDSVSPAYLYSFDNTVPGVVNNLGQVRTVTGAIIDVDGLAWSSQSGLLAFQIAEENGVTTGSTLVALDSSTATATAIGTKMDRRDIRGAVFDNQGRLWVVDAIGDQLLTIDPTTGAILTTVDLSLGASAFNLSTATDLAIASDGTFYLASTYGMYTLDTATGAVTLQHTFGTDNALAGLAFSNDGPSNILYGYEINGSDDLYTYDILNSYARTTFALDFISGFNAGRGDLATMTTVVPLPAAVLLGSLGLSLAGWRLRRR